MKLILVGTRPTLNQRLAELFERRGFQVASALPEDDILEAMTKEPFDVMVFVAPDDEKVVADLVLSAREVRPSIHVYVLAEDGSINNLIPKLQPVLGTKVSVNDLPSQLQQEIGRVEGDREHFRLEWLKFAEEVVDAATASDSIRESGNQVLQIIQRATRASGCAIVLQPDPAKPPEAVCKAGETDALTRVFQEKTAIQDWLLENQNPLLLRRGRSGIPGLQRELVKYGLGPSIFIPLITSQTQVGAIALTRPVEADSFPESAFTLARLAARAMTVRVGSTEAASLDDVRAMLQQERHWRQSLEDSVAEGRDLVRRLARELAVATEQSEIGYPLSETVSKLAVTLAEQVELSTDNLPEAVFLRNVGGTLARTTLSAGLASGQLSPQEVAYENSRRSFEILSRIRLPSVCLEVARHHRENYDGSGGPDGIKGEDIPLGARVVRVVEDYVEMTTSARGSRAATSPDALALIMREAGKTYDPRIAETFTKLIRAQGVTPEQETLSLIAHELRTPLTFLVGFSELLAARTDLPSQAKEMASELHKQTEQMVVITERLLEISRLQSARVALSLQWANMRDLVSEQITKVRSLSDKHRLTIEAPAYPVRLRVDSTRIGQAVGNLLTNAVRYSPAGGDVHTCVEESATEVTISVTDHGVGIAQDKLDRLFQPFYRVQRAETSHIEGLGLGLALTRAIVEAHGGKVSAASTVGKGSTFTITLPKRESAIEPART